MLPTVLDLLGMQTTENVRRTEPRAADDRREQRARARGLLRGGVSALSFRMERPARAERRPIQIHRGAAARSSTISAGPGRDDTTSSPQRRALAVSMAGHLRRSSSASRRAPRQRARLRRSIPTRAIGWPRSATSARSCRGDATDRTGAGRSQGQDRAVQSDDAARARSRATTRSPTKRSRARSTSTRQDPKVIDAWFMLGNEYLPHRQFDAGHRAATSGRSR